MTKAEKINVVSTLADEVKEHNGFYIIDMNGFTSAQSHKFRSEIFKANLKVEVVKNTLIQKSLEEVDSEEYAQVFPHLKNFSAIIFVGENANVPAKVIKKFRESNEKPTIKVVYIDKALFVGDDSLEPLSKLKSKNELLGEVIGLLQSPPKNVISALKSAGGKLAGILKTLSERNS